MILGLQLFHFKMAKSTPRSMSISANQIRELVVPSPCETEPYSKGCYHLVGVFHLIIKITISSIVIGLKNSYFSLNSLAKLLSDSLLLDSLLSDSSKRQSYSKL